MTRLVVEKGELAGHGYDLTRSVIVIGRGQDCDIILDEHQVSRQHARLQYTPQGWTLVDLGSTNGTQVNGQPLKAHAPYLLRLGDRVALGTAVVSLQQPVTAEPAPQDAPPERRPKPALLIAGAVLFAVVVVGIVVVLVLTLRGPKDDTTPGGLDPLEQVEEGLPIPTLIEGITTALPIPTQLEELATSLPTIPSDLEDMKTSLPIPTQIQDLVTRLPIEPPKLPMQTLATPPPAGQ